LMRNKKSSSTKILEELAQGFQKRTIPANYMDDPGSRAAYGDYYGEVGFEKGFALISEMVSRVDPGFFREKSPFRLIDLGTGTGGFLRGVVSGLEGLDPPVTEFDILCVDRSLGALEDLQKKWTIEKTVPLRIRSGSLVEPPLLFEGFSGISLITMANVLAENEGRVSDFVNLFDLLFDRLDPGGGCLLAEPADRKASRALLQLGDQLISRRSDVRIVAPCPNNRTGSCPALADPDNWCHEDRPAEFSPGLKRTALALGHVKDALKMSYLMMRRERPQAHSSPRTLRLVSSLHQEKGLSWGIFCDGSHLLRVRLLNRNRNEGTRVFSRLKRGDVLVSPEFHQESDAEFAKNPSCDWRPEDQVILLTRADGRPVEREHPDPGQES